MIITAIALPHGIEPQKIDDYTYTGDATNIYEYWAIGRIVSRAVLEAIKEGHTLDKEPFIVTITFREEPQGDYTDVKHPA